MSALADYIGPALNSRRRVVLAIADLVEALRAWVSEDDLSAWAKADAQQPDTARRLLSIRELAEQSGNSERALTAWCRKGRLRGEKHGKKWRVDPQEWDKFRAHGRAKARVGNRVAALGPPQRIRGGE